MYSYGNVAGLNPAEKLLCWFAFSISDSLLIAESACGF